MQRRPIYVFETTSTTGLDKVPVGSTITVTSTGVSYFVSNKTSITGSTTVAQAVGSKSLIRSSDAKGVVMTSNDIDCSLGEVFTKTITAATTFTISNAQNNSAVLLKLTNAGSQIITWPAGTKWKAGVLPTLTVTGVDYIGLVTTDGGLTWAGLSVSIDAR
jgi:hypothetical protein